MYDIGIHYVAGMSENVSACAEDIKQKIISSGGDIVSQSDHESVDLAYEILGKHMTKEGVYPRHTKSLFFSLCAHINDSALVQEIHTHLEGNSDVVRHLIVKTNEELVCVDKTLYMKEVKKHADDEVVEGEDGEDDEQEDEEKREDEA